MALRPSTSPAERVVTTDIPIETSRTYDLFTTAMRSYVDGDEAIRQFIRKALLTARYTFLIYNSEYGNEIDSLIGRRVNNALFDAEIVRLIREALIYDSRIASVDNFVIERNTDAVFITFDVTTVSGAVMTEGVTL